MPFTFNGCGTSYYGKRYPAQDGSYVTTKWVTGVWIPLLPLGSYRVRPTGKGTNAVVYHSQNFQTVRVPLCWPQVRNVYIFIAPILALILYFNWADIQKWWKEEAFKSTPTHVVLKAESPQVQPADADVALGSKEAAAACGNVMKLDKVAFSKLNLHSRLAKLITDGEFTNEELADKNFSEKDLQEQAFSAYALAYVAWDKPMSRASLDKKFIDGIGSVNLSDLSSDQRTYLETYLAKIKRMMLKAFDLGRHDAKISPCPS